MKPPSENVLDELDILHRLADCDPVVIGTQPRKPATSTWLAAIRAFGERAQQDFGHLEGGKVMALEQHGLKTEPAFARLLNLEGDPFEAMLRLEMLSGDELALLAARALTG